MGLGYSLLLNTACKESKPSLKNLSGSSPYMFTQCFSKTKEPGLFDPSSALIMWFRIQTPIIWKSTLRESSEPVLSAFIRNFPISELFHHQHLVDCQLMLIPWLPLRGHDPNLPGHCRSESHCPIIKNLLPPFMHMQRWRRCPSSALVVARLFITDLGALSYSIRPIEHHGGRLIFPHGYYLKDMNTSAGQAPP